MSLGGCLVQKPCVCARPDWRCALSRVLGQSTGKPVPRARAGCLRPQRLLLLDSGGTEDVLAGNIYLKALMGGAATAGEDCAIEGAQCDLEVFIYPEVARMPGRGTKPSRWPLGASWPGRWIARTCESTGAVRTRKPVQDFRTSGHRDRRTEARSQV